MALKASELKVGDTYTERLVEDLKRTQIVQYAGSSGDYNPLHTDEIFTTKVAGYPSVFAHGMLSMGMTGTYADELCRRRPADQIRRALHESGLARRYARCDRHGRSGSQGRRQDTSSISSVTTVNQNGVEVIKGNATARVD